MSNIPKGKLALYWAASCGGCEIAVLAINEKILDVAALFDIVFWPVAVDAKVHDVEKMPDKSIDVCLFNGGIRTSEQEYMAQLLRRKSKVLVAFGSCASEGCIPGLANATSRRKIFDTVYHDTPSTENPERIEPQTKTAVPEGTLHLPVFYETLRTLGQTVPVDYSLPGCPPEAERIWEAILAIVENRLPPPAGLGDRRGNHRLRRVQADEERKEGQEVLPHLAGHPRRGDVPAGAGPAVLRDRHAGRLRGPLPAGQLAVHRLLRAEPGRRGFRRRMMAALSSMIDSNDPEEIDRIIRDGIPDPVGSFYRFSLAGSHLRRAKKVQREMDIT